MSMDYKFEDKKELRESFKHLHDIWDVLKSDILEYKMLTFPINGIKSPSNICEVVGTAVSNRERLFNDEDLINLGHPVPIYDRVVVLKKIFNEVERSHSINKAFTEKSDGEFEGLLGTLDQATNVNEFQTYGANSYDEWVSTRKFEDLRLLETATQMIEIGEGRCSKNILNAGMLVHELVEQSLLSFTDEEMIGALKGCMDDVLARKIAKIIGFRVDGLVWTKQLDRALNLSSGLITIMLVKHGMDRHKLRAFLSNASVHNIIMKTEFYKCFGMGELTRGIEYVNEMYWGQEEEEDV